MKKLYQYSILTYVFILFIVSFYMFSVKVRMVNICNVSIEGYSSNDHKIHLKSLSVIRKKNLKSIYLTYHFIQSNNVFSDTISVQIKSGNRLEIDRPNNNENLRNTIQILNPQLLVEYEVPIYFLTIQNIINPFKS